MNSMDEAVSMIANFMAVSAKTAPKGGGKDFVGIKVIADREQIEKLADAMLEYGKETGKKDFDRDSKNIRNSAAILLLSLDKHQPAGTNCGACGFNECKQLVSKEGSEFKGPLCAWRLLDLGIALGSAVKTASLFNVDNRIMYRVGVLARKINLIEGEIVVGVPLSATSKSIYFDR